ncbi:MAG: phosphopentomutase [Lachnospiraceae bacterium]|nr:phosphopentomutase [Lachnospiraceae bacterium]
MSKRVFIIVLDSCGIGEEPDAHLFGDADCNTMRSISKDPAYRNETTRKIGLANIDGQEYLGPVEHPTGAYARLREKSMGKDTTIGHWEIAGVISPEPLPTYPNGFPEEVLAPFREATGRGVLCNLPYSGTEVIKDYGEEHMRTGDLIVYTSADSVFQIAANEALVPTEQLYEYCRIARKILTGKHGVGRVIARPFIGTSAENFKRTANRHDFSLDPPKPTVLNAAKDAGLDVYAIGKINDIFAGSGVTEYVYTHSNTEGMQLTMDALEKDFHGICFTNLVDFDMLYGHRRDITGYAKAYAEFDGWLAEFLPKMKAEDIVIITADHGCDPADKHHTDHTREYIPFLMAGPSVKPANYGTQPTFAAIAATVADYLGIPYECEGKVLR